MFKYLKSLSGFEKIFLLFAVLYPLLLLTLKIYTGNIAFWHDPARDLLMALEEHNKISLIGQPGGIPGIFYGPYWYLLLSGILYLTKDVRVVDAIVLLIPYIIVIPLMLIALRKEIGNRSIPILLIIFYLTFNGYVLNLWHVHLAPIILLLMIYVFYRISLENSKKQNLLYLLTGVLGGLLINFHYAVGTSVLIGSLIITAYLNLYDKKKIKKNIIIKKTLVSYLMYMSGFIVIMLPLIIFDIRHNFILTNVIKTYLYNTMFLHVQTITEHGLSNNQILNYLFVYPIMRLFTFNYPLAVIMTFIINIGALYLIFKQKISKSSRKLLTINYIFLLTIGIVYLLSSNPIWDYHFIGVSIMYLIIIGVLINYYTKTVYILYIYIAFLVIASGSNALISYRTHEELKIPTYAMKKHVVDLIDADRGSSQSYYVYYYNAKVFPFEYDYLYNSRYQDWASRRAENNPVYIIVPAQESSAILQFITDNTPDNKYDTEKIITTEEGTRIIKRTLQQQ